MILDGIAYNQVGIGVAQEVLTPTWCHMALGVSLGIYIRNHRDERIGSNFTFGERLFLSIDTKRLVYEIFARHYSNGALATPNAGYTSVGLSLLFKLPHSH
ncbi:hypothetical protein BJI48_05645 [Helicobacter sp. 11S02596-1]|nr:hypothetical protein BJI48_05645 [Helicobacter sp. 11S02596-1]